VVYMSIDAHPELPEFDYIRPASLGEASRFLAEHAGEARPLSGGTDIFVRMRDGFFREKYLVDIKELDGTARIDFEPPGSARPGLTIGAGVNMNRVMGFPAVIQVYPLLEEACRWVASYQLRSRATIVGNICNASPAGDTIGASLAFGGVLKVHGVDGFRDEPLASLSQVSFFTGPGKTVLRPGDIVTAIRFPLPPEGSAGAYIKLGRNNWSDLSIVGVTAFAYPDSSARSGFRFRLALASVAPTPLIPAAAQDFLAETPPGPPAFKEAARLAAQACTPIDDVRGSARYRKAMVNRLTEKALLVTWERLTSKG
jgi:CO/xanthine dehydrogenase FAD-binding subunit